MTVFDYNWLRISSYRKKCLPIHEDIFGQKQLEMLWVKTSTLWIRYSPHPWLTISWPTLTHCPVRSAKSPSQCFFSYIGVVSMTMSYGQMRLRVPVVPLCSERKNSGTTSDQANGALRCPNGAIKLELILLFWSR